VATACTGSLHCVAHSSALPHHYSGVEGQKFVKLEEGQDSSGSQQEKVAGSCEIGNELLGPIKVGNFWTN